MADEDKKPEDREEAAPEEKDARKPGENEDAEGEEGEEGEGAKKKAGGRKKLIIFGAIGAVGIVVVGAVAWFFLGPKPEGGQDGSGYESGLASVYVEVPPMTLNLMADGSGEHFLKTRIMLEVANEKDRAAAMAALPRLQDDWNTFLRQLRPEDMQGSAAIQRLKEGLLRRARQALAPVPVRQVLLTELLVQ